MIAMCKEAGRPICSAFVAFTILTMLGAGAQAADSVRLTQATVKQFIASFKDVKAIALRQAKARGENIKPGKEALSAVVEAVKDKALKGEVEKVAQAHGFQNAKELTGVATAVAVTYAHLKLSPEDDKNRRKIEKAIAKIEKNPLLNEKAKRKLIDAVRSGSDALEPPPSENVAVVKPMLAEIDAAVKK